MIEVNLEVCRTISLQYGLPLQFVIKEFYLFDVLSQVTMSLPLSLAVLGGRDVPKAVFKGGTALNKVYLGKLQRFSEDLDFDLDTTQFSDVRDLCNKLASGIKGYEITEFRKVKNTLQFYCAFQNPLGNKDHIRVDVAAKKIVTEKLPLVKPAVSEYTDRFVTGFYVYSLEDLVVRKMNALADRCEGKDIYDVHAALPMCGKLDKAIRKMLESENSKLGVQEFIEKAIRSTKAADAKKLQRLANPLIPSNSRPRDWLELRNDLALKLEELTS